MEQSPLSGTNGSSVNKLSAFYGTRMFITAFTRACNAETHSSGIALPYGLLSNCMLCSHGPNVFKAQANASWQLPHLPESVCSFAEDLPACRLVITAVSEEPIPSYLFRGKCFENSSPQVA
jgi:hypothetical protein